MVAQAQGRDPFWRAVGVAQKAAVAEACGAASPQRNRADVSVSDHSRSWVSGRGSCLSIRGLESAPIGPVIVRNEWTTGWWGGVVKGQRWIRPTNRRTGGGMF